MSEGASENALDWLVFKENGAALNPNRRTFKTSPNRTSIIVVNAMCVVEGNPALGKSKDIAGVALKEPTAAVTDKGRGLTGPDAALVSIVHTVEFHRTPFCGIEIPTD